MSPTSVVFCEVFSPHVIAIEFQKGNPTVEAYFGIGRASQAVATAPGGSNREDNSFVVDVRNDGDTPVLLGAYQESTAERELVESVYNLGNFHAFS